MALQFIHQIFTEHLLYVIRNNSYVALLPEGIRERSQQELPLPLSSIAGMGVLMVLRPYQDMLIEERFQTQLTDLSLCLLSRSLMRLLQVTGWLISMKPILLPHWQSLPNVLGLPRQARHWVYSTILHRGCTE